MQSSTSSQPEPQDKPTILVVDDEATVRLVVNRVFSRDACVVEAASAEEALVWLERHEADIVISDYRMAGMSGIELMGALRRARPDIARVLISANCDIESTTDALNDGLISRFVRKPWRNEELETVVRLALRDRRLLQRTRRAVQDLAAVAERLRFIPAARDEVPALRLVHGLLEEHERRITWGA